jgi:hypothetical protein
MGKSYSSSKFPCLSKTIIKINFYRFFIFLLSNRSGSETGKEPESNQFNENFIAFFPLIIYYCTRILWGHSAELLEVGCYNFLFFVLNEQKRQKLTDIRELIFT